MCNEYRVAECDEAEACANMESSGKSAAARSTNPISRIIRPETPLDGCNKEPI